MPTFSHKIYNQSELDKARFNLLEPGDYRFQIQAASLETSKKGNPMIKLTVAIMEDIYSGKYNTIFDYIMDSEKMCWKIHHLLKSVGLEHLYSMGQWDVNILANKCGTAKIAIKKDKTREYPDQNIIVDYLSGNDVSPEPAKSVSNAEDTDIPF